MRSLVPNTNFHELTEYECASQARKRIRGPTIYDIIPLISKLPFVILISTRCLR